MTKITGRPPKAVKQEKFIGFFDTNEQYGIIEEKAAQAKVNISDYMRQIAVNGYVKIRWTEEDVALIKQLVALSNDLHAVVGVAEREGVLSAMLWTGGKSTSVVILLRRVCGSQSGVGAPGTGSGVVSGIQR
jgi:hypothetical protein